MDVSRLEAGRLKGSFRLVNLGLVTRDLAVSPILCSFSSKCFAELMSRRSSGVLLREYVHHDDITSILLISGQITIHSRG
jgi:hypothetical protein